jgi:hypothetical protein
MLQKFNIQETFVHHSKIGAPFLALMLHTNQSHYWLDLWCLMPRSTIFQLYCGCTLLKHQIITCKVASSHAQHSGLFSKKFQQTHLDFSHSTDISNVLRQLYLMLVYSFLRRLKCEILTNNGWLDMTKACI